MRCWFFSLILLSAPQSPVNFAASFAPSVLSARSSPLVDRPRALAKEKKLFMTPLLRQSLRTSPSYLSIKGGAADPIEPSEVCPATPLFSVLSIVLLDRFFFAVFKALSIQNKFVSDFGEVIFVDSYKFPGVLPCSLPLTHTHTHTHTRTRTRSLERTAMSASAHSYLSRRPWPAASSSSSRFTRLTPSPPPSPKFLGRRGSSTS